MGEVVSVDRFIDSFQMVWFFRVALMKLDLVICGWSRLNNDTLFLKRKSGCC